MIGITGTGGAGKSSLTDEVIRRFRLYSGEPKIAVIAVDPTRRKSGGALLGDRIRMNAIDGANIYMRSIATRDSGREIPPALPEIIIAAKAAGFDLVIVETPGIGQGDAGIVPLVDLSLYVMTPEFGAASQLEKIDMLDFADVVVINKFDRQGGRDALRDVAKQIQRNRLAFAQTTEAMPVFGSIAARFNDDGVTAVYREIVRQLNERGLGAWETTAPQIAGRSSEPGAGIVPAARRRYLAEIAETVRGYHRTVAEQVAAARDCQHLREARPPAARGGARAIRPPSRCCWPRPTTSSTRAAARCWRCGRRSSTPTPARNTSCACATRRSARRWLRPRSPAPASPRCRCRAGATTARSCRGCCARTCPAASPIPPASSPSSARARIRRGCSPAKAIRSAPTPASSSSPRTADAKRLSTAFDSVTLYGFDPDERPDIYGKIGNSGVSIATLDDIEALYDGFDLCSPYDLGVDDHQRPGADHPRDVLQHRHRPAARPLRGRERPGGRPRRRRRRSPSGRWRTSAAPSRPTSSRRTRARTPASSRPSSR